VTTPPVGQAQATLAGGCFWCLEATFERLRGVFAVKNGYAGGASPRPTYNQVCSGTSGHAEVVQVTYDPRQVSYRDLLEVFFTIHDPTQLNRQGPDVGSQYRSAIFPHTPEQDAEARAVIAELVAQQIYDLPVVTTVEPDATFWPAESNHDRYFKRHPFQPYCLAVIAPKVAKLRAKHADKLKD
jgi:peptide-methionine (S)-S-oxide reductase